LVDVTEGREMSGRGSRIHLRGALANALVAALLVDMSKPRPLADLPNSNGFRFTGHRKDGSKLQCVVNVDKTGIHLAVCVESGRKVYNELSGWSPQEL
jgi:hypothetical protein